MDTPLPDLEVSVDNTMPKNPTVTPFKSSTCQFMLRMAQSHLAKNELRLATDVFIRIIEEYPSSEERKVAQDGVLSIAQHYEKEGQFRVALDLLEKIDKVLAKA
ncbi:MAG: TolA-binding protein [Candidatus Azotimanducaceae bacterium]|jgi:TolA-binding protein